MTAQLPAMLTGFSYNDSVANITTLVAASHVSVHYCFIIENEVDNRC